MLRMTAAAVLAVAALAAKEEVTFGMGSFFDAEQKLDDSDLKVLRVVKGYAGGFARKPDYKSVMKGKTGHALVVNVEFDTEKTALKQIVQHFFRQHDPFAVNKQDNKIGSQYRSILLFRNAEQNETMHAVAAEFLKQHRAEHDEPQMLATEIVPFDEFFPAADDIGDKAAAIDEEVEADVRNFVKSKKGGADGMDKEAAGSGAIDVAGSSELDELDERERERSRLLEEELRRREKEVQRAVADNDVVELRRLEMEKPLHLELREEKAEKGEEEFKAAVMDQGSAHADDNVGSEENEKEARENAELEMEDNGWMRKKADDKADDKGDDDA